MAYAPCTLIPEVRANQSLNPHHATARAGAIIEADVDARVEAVRLTEVARSSEHNGYHN